MIADLFTALVRVFTGARGRWVGCAPTPENARPRVYFANHTSNLDFVVLWATLPREHRTHTRAAAARDYWTATAPRRWIATRVFNVVLIERKQVTRTNNPVDQLSAVLRDGDSLIIFPEGGRTADAALAPFKSGLYHLAQRNPEAELIPVYIENLNRVLPKGEVLAIPLICTVTYGAPLRMEANEARDTFLERARHAVEALQSPTQS
jgi:1-acyl-sn-glycerol-3-phosphate acyltransferase